MEVPRYLYVESKENIEIFNEINSAIKVLENEKKELIHPYVTINNKTRNVTKIVLRFLIYQQVALWRIVDLSNAILHCWETKLISPAFIILRALYENASVLFYMMKKLESLINNKKVIEIHKFIIRFTYGTRISSTIEQEVKKERKRIKMGNSDYSSEQEIRETYRAVNILTIIDKLDKNLNNHRDDYDHLCEYSHPNYDALIGLYGKHQDSISIKINNEIGINKMNILNFFSRFNISLKLFTDGYNGIIGKMEDLHQLVISDLKKKGKKTDLYDEKNELN